MADLFIILLILGMAWFLFARPKPQDDSQDDSDWQDRPDPSEPPRRNGRPDPRELRPPSRYEDQRQDGPPPVRPVPPPPQDEPPGPQEASDAYRRAQAMWDALRSTPDDQSRPPSSPPPGRKPAGAPSGEPRQPSPLAPDSFDQEDFLDGARMVYARIQESWDARDLEDIEGFVDEQVFRNLTELAQNDPHPSSTAILNIDASFLELVTEQDQERASVRFKVRLAKEDQPPYRIEEIWHFGRAAAESGHAPGMWKVVGISQVA